MSIGFLLGIAAAFIWSLTNIVDKYLVTKYAPNGNVGGIVILSCFFPLVLVPFGLYFAPTIWLPLTEILILILSGVLMVIWLTQYLKALSYADTSIVMALLMLAPVFGFIFASIILNETLTNYQIIAGLTILAGALVLTINFKQKSLHVPVLVTALSASVVMGLLHTLFKSVAIEEEFWSSLIWRAVGMVITGVIIYLTHTSARHIFNQFLKTSSVKILSFNAINESLTVIGDTIFAYAILFAPIALIQSTEAYQPIFILIITFVISNFTIIRIEEDMSKRILLQKIIGIFIVIIGSAMLFVGIKP
ncbi:MAG: DMT family transporter [Patescibacteria group bacterium]